MVDRLWLIDNEPSAVGNQQTEGFTTRTAPTRGRTEKAHFGNQHLVASLNELNRIEQKETKVTKNALR